VFVLIIIAEKGKGGKRRNGFPTPENGRKP
jgi:hypothetical protein